MVKPGYIQWGPKTLRDYLNALVDYVDQVKPIRGPGITLNETPSGTSISTAAGTAAGTATSGEPFTVTVSGTDITISPGTCNQLLPSNMFDTFTFSPGDLVQVKVRGVSDGEAITSCSLVVDTDAPAVQSPAAFSLPTSVDILVAVISDSVAFRTIGAGSVTLNGVEQFKVDKSPPADPGELTYTPYYVWSI